MQNDDDTLNIYTQAFKAGQGHAKSSPETLEMFSTLFKLNEKSLENQQKKYEIIIKELREIASQKSWTKLGAICLLIITVGVCLLIAFLFVGTAMS